MLKIVCPVPLIQCPGREGSNDDGIRMYCTNKDCTHSLILVHPQCKKDLEEKLTKSMKKSGKTRRLTNAQNRDNIWTNKCRFLNKSLKCKCGNGLLYINRNQPNDHDLALNNAKAKQFKEQKPKLKMLSHQMTKAERKEQSKLDFHYLSVHHREDIHLKVANPKEKIVTVAQFPRNYLTIIDENDKQQVDVPEWVKETFETGGQEAVIVRVRERFAAELARRKIRLPITASVDDLEETPRFGLYFNSHKSSSVESNSSTSSLSTFESGRQSTSSIISDSSRYSASDDFANFIFGLKSKSAFNFDDEPRKRNKKSKWKI